MSTPTADGRRQTATLVKRKTSHLPRTQAPGNVRFRVHVCGALILGVAAACSSDGAPPVALSEPAASQTSNSQAPTSNSQSPTLTQTPTLTLTPTQTPSATHLPKLRQLTTGGCCVQPFWSSDGTQVRYIDRPDPTLPSGLWGVDVSGGEPEFITDRLGIVSPDGSLIAYLEAGETYVERTSDGERWVVPSGGRAISFSPDGSLIAWQVALSQLNFDRRTVEVWVARVDGSGARLVGGLTGGGLSGWFPDGRRLLVSGRESAGADPFLASLSISDATLTVITQAERLRGGSISPEGGWIAYQVTFSSDPALDGLWATRTDGSEANRLEEFGSYRWRSEGRLIVIPLDNTPTANSHYVLEFDATTRRLYALTDPAITRFRIGGGDWSLSPDGNRIAFVSADDHNIWIIDLVP